MKLAIAAIVLAASTASARPPKGVSIPFTEAGAVAHADDDVPRVLWLNRCAGGCVIHKSAGEDAQTQSSLTPKGPTGDYPMTEFDDGDAKWAELVQCVKEVYSPYDVMVTDVRPTQGTFNEAIVAGLPSEIGWQGAGGVAPVNCKPYNNVISFSFSKIYGGDMIELCATVAQESGHAYAMDHEYEFLDGRSACTDPMTYRQDCGGQQFFRNDPAYCGEYDKRGNCLCGDTSQNSHLHLLAALGAGHPITKPPVIAYNAPPAGTVLADTSTPISGTASSQRGVRRVELWINGYKWAEVPGAEWGQNGQPSSVYQPKIPKEVPDSVLDVQLIAKDDIDMATATDVVRITKGKACTDASQCLDGMRCDDQGRCLWDPPVGEQGEDCTFDQYCKSGVCDEICTTTCIPGTTDSCPDDTYECVQGATKPVCYPRKAKAPGCDCSVGEPGSVALQSGLLACAFAFVMSRRRRR